MWKKISCLLATMVFLLAGSMEVSAAEENINEADKVGSITIELADTEDGTLKDNVTFSIKKIADIKKGELILLEEYKDLGFDLNEIETAEDLSLVANELSKVVTNGTKITTDVEGKAALENLEVGVYLIYGEGPAKYGTIIPFAVSIPTLSETEGIMIYDITVTPKYTPLLTAIQVNKVDSVTKEAIVSKDFEFGLYSDKECTKLIKTENADQETGTATFKDLRYGTYYVKEIDAPKGYQLSDEVKKIVINNDLEGVGEVHSFVYENILLPASFLNTGDSSTIFLFVGLAIISLLGIGFVVVRKKAKNEL